MINKLILSNLKGIKRDSVKNIFPSVWIIILSLHKTSLFPCLLPLRMPCTLEDSLLLLPHYDGIIPDYILDSHPYTTEKCNSHPSPLRSFFGDRWALVPKATADPKTENNDYGVPQHN